METIDTTILDQAIVFAVEAHAGQTRKGTTSPYILHPLEAAAVVATLTNDVEVMAAAVLHDTVEDNREITVERIEREFGSRIARLVAGESEIKEPDEVGSWEKRKQATLDYLNQEATPEEKIIALGDKVSNIRAIYRDQNTVGDQLWERFNQKDKKRHAWYYHGIRKALVSLEKSDAYDEYQYLVYKVFGPEDPVK